MLMPKGIKISNKPCVCGADVGGAAGSAGGDAAVQRGRGGDGGLW